MKRASGILFPIFSLPSAYRIGCFSKEAYEFVDQLKEAGQSYWQILPLTPTSYGDSPYQSFSSFAGNPYFIDLETLIEEGVLTKEECDACDFGDDEGKIDYGKLYEARFGLLQKAYSRSKIYENEDFLRFARENAAWLDDYALFMSIKKIFEGKSWDKWADDIRERRWYALDYYREKCYFDVEFYKYLQFKFAEQWKKLKTYANSKGIEIIGDIPIYVAFDSADAWANPEMFQFDSKCQPTAVAGCPPDAFAEDGQLWGNPLYRWEHHRQTGYEWWCRRVKHCFNLYDIVRIDHFRGFDEYYSIPFGDKTARNGHWVKGPGIELFQVLRAKLGELKIIAEDLGLQTPTVEKLLADSGYPGMKVLEFAFDSDVHNSYLPHNYDRNSVVYTGTHDNATLLQWYKSLDEKSLALIQEYTDKTEEEPIEKKCYNIIRLAMMSCSNTCIIPFQDYTLLDEEARINLPSTSGINWMWRAPKSLFTEEQIEKIYDMTAKSARLAGQARVPEVVEDEDETVSDDEEETAETAASVTAEAAEVAEAAAETAKETVAADATEPESADEAERKA